MRPSLLILFAALLALPSPAPALAQGTPGWSPWGGPDSPGGMFGGNPLEADADRDRNVTHDEVWTWLRQRFDLADRDRSGALERHEIGSHAGAHATFRAADADRNGRVTFDELRPLSESWFRAHDANQDGVLTRGEVPARRKAKRQG